MSEWDKIEDLSEEELRQAELIANEMLVILGRNECEIDVAWAAIDMIVSVVQDMEEDVLQHETNGLNGVDFHA